MVKKIYYHTLLGEAFMEKMHLGNPNYLVVLQSLDSDIYTLKDAIELWLATAPWRQKPIIF